MAFAWILTYIECLQINLRDGGELGHDMVSDI